ncbi:hypothetical protein BC941DRAFT_418799 [Chlamydoabsidia padenii]|nr:hypothetical protein BC941DRAFT_418799 [Chlamydoabsidia padenii]
MWPTMGTMTMILVLTFLDKTATMTAFASIVQCVYKALVFLARPLEHLFAIPHNLGRRIFMTGMAIVYQMVMIMAVTFARQVRNAINTGGIVIRQQATYGKV